jgi:transposase
MSLLSLLTRALCSTGGWELRVNCFHKRTTNGFTEGCHTKIKILKGVSYDLRNVDIYWRKMPLKFVPRSSFHTI